MILPPPRQQFDSRRHWSLLTWHSEPFFLMLVYPFLIRLVLVLKAMAAVQVAWSQFPCLACCVPPYLVPHLPNLVFLLPLVPQLYRLSLWFHLQRQRQLRFLLFPLPLFLQRLCYHLLTLLLH